MINIEILKAALLLPFLVGIVCSSVAWMIRSRRLAMAGALGSMLIAAVASSMVMSSGSVVRIVGYLSVTPLSAFFLFLAASAIALIDVLAFRYSDAFISFSFTMTLAFAGMFFVASATSLLPIILGLELMTVSTTFMTLVHGKNKAEAAIKLFVFGSLAIAVMSFAISLLFSYSPALSLTPISASAGYVAMLALALFIVALGFETSSFPFNLWVPDVYQGASTFITALLAGVNKKIAFLALIEVLFFVFAGYAASFSLALQVLAIATMFFGNIMALKQKNLKRLFAYSSISQAGYILIGIATATTQGLTASLFYIFAHSFMIIGAFAIILLLESANIRTVDECKGLYTRNGIVAAVFAIIMLSMAGIPGLIGFFGKFLLFSSAFRSHMLILGLVGIINSFISVYYYGRVINAMFNGDRGRSILLEPYVQIVIVFVAAIIIMFGIFPQPLVQMASNAAAFIPIP